LERKLKADVYGLMGRFIAYHEDECIRKKEKGTLGFVVNYRSEIVAANNCYWRLGAE